MSRKPLTTFGRGVAVLVSLCFGLLATDASAVQVGPSHPGFDDGTVAPAPTATSARGTAILNVDTGLLYATIQAAHDDVLTLAGHTLEVQDLNHTEGPQIAITKGVTLRGATGSETVLQSADTASSGDARGWFLLDAAASGFTAADLTFDGNGFRVWQGFRSYAPNVTFDNCTFNDLQFDASGPSYAGTAVVTINAPGMVVQDCAFSQIGRQGIFFFGAPATGGVAQNNVYTGKGVGDWLDYGIEIGGGAVATCTNNTITDCRGVASSDGSTSAAAIITTFFGAGTAADLTGNFLNANTGAVAAGFDGADVSVITATDNDLSGNDTYTVNSTSTTAVQDFSGNWHGSSAAGAVAAGLVGTAGGVDYTPWLDVGTDTDGVSPGFQGDFSTLNVDDDSAQVGASGRITEGVDLVTASTVIVMPGTYVENVLINKDVTVLSAGGRAVTTIQGISSVGALGAITVTGGTTGVQLGAAGQGFTVLGIDNGAPGIENAAVYFQGNHNNAQILDNEIVAQGDHGLLTEYGAVINGFVIDGNEFSGSTFFDPPADFGFGNQFTTPNVPRQLVTMGGGGGGGSTSNTTFTNNLVSGVAGGTNVALQEQGNTLATIDSNGATITGNTFAGTTNRFASSLRTRGPATTVSGNNFDSSGIQWPLRATGHHYVENTGTDTGAIVGLNTYDKSVHINAPVGVIGWSIAAFAASAAVPGGSTIVAGPGTYTEQIIVDGKDLTIVGAGVGTSIIASPASLVTTFGTGPVNYPIITATNSGNIVVDGFTIDGLGNGNANNRFIGVAFWNGGGKLLNSRVTGIRETPANGNQHGVGVYSFNDTGGPYALEVGSCTFDDYQKNAMALSGDGMVVDVHDCATVGAGDVAYIAQNGIQVSFGAGGSVTDCNVSALRYTPATAVSSGILAFSCGSPLTTAGNNVVTTTQAPVSWYDTDGTCGGIENPDGGDFDAIFVYNSTSLRSNEHPLPQPLQEPHMPGRAPTPFAVAFDDNCLTGTGLAGTSGIYALAATGSLDLDISGMDITGFDYGIFLDGAGVSCTANDNSIAGNLTAGLDNSSSGNPVDAELNWWGAADGPSGVGPGTGDAIAGPAVDFDPFRIDGTSTVACGFVPLPATIEPNPAPGICVSGPTPCVTVPMDIFRTENSHARGYSVTFTLSSELELCAGLASITQNTYLNSIGGTNFQVLDNGGGSYTVDCAILGLPCGQTAATGTLFDVDVQASGGDGSGTITVTSVLLRDCDNVPLPAAPGAAAIIPIDTAPPVAIADLSVAQVKTGNPAGDKTGIDVTFTAPVDAAEVRVYAKGFGNYPEYDDAPGAGSVPATPSFPPSGWTLTTATTSGDTVYLPSRDYWYFVVFTRDDCDNWSAVSNQTGGTLNYHLGDVSDGGTPGQGDNLVGVADISLLGANYGIPLVPSDAVGYLDVGPTDDFSVDGLPTTDDLVNFEDLILFAINYGQVSAPRSLPNLVGEMALFEPAVVLDVTRENGQTVARLSLVDNPDRVKGIHAFLSLEGLEVVSATQGSLTGEQGAPVFFKTVDEAGGIWVDLAALGRDIAFEGSGEFAVLTLSGDGSAHLGDAVLRDRDNRDASRHPVDPEPVSSGQTTSAVSAGLPSQVELAPARPNPFNSSTEIVFRLPASAPVSLTVYDVTGRLVRTLVDRTVGAGEMSVTWDGRANDGRLTGAGIYFYTFQTTDHRETRKLLRMN